MQYIRETAIGQIQVDGHIIQGLISEAIAPYIGKVFLSGKNGKPIRHLRPGRSAEEPGGFEMEVRSGTVYIKLYLIVRFGVSISGVSGDIMDDIRKSIRDALGDVKIEVSIVVTGTLGRNLIRRNIHVLEEDPS